MQLAAVDPARGFEDMFIPELRLHPLNWVDDNWQLIFEVRDGHAYVLDYENDH
jgi:proteic killer suppression protein